MAEAYEFEYSGASFHVTVENPATHPSTTLGPNMRVVSGSWPTWRLDLDLADPTAGPSSVLLRRSVSAAGGAHPSGNLSFEQSGPNGYLLMIAKSNALYQVPGGFALVSRLLTAAEWDALRASWEKELKL
ncbi:hypothetical protein [Microbacterium sp. ZW T5_56]|uniref:hypothetical protein n=1 Tax=Microbacterium sp. ZW T5_56 TaxID=3378081 RepID=UPI0038549040